MYYAAAWVRAFYYEQSMLMNSSGIAPGQCIIASEFHTFETVLVALLLKADDLKNVEFSQ